MYRIPATPRHDWRETAKALGFHFHTIDGEPYWDESAYYAFTLTQIEQHIEGATEQLEQLCLEAVSQIIGDERQLRRLRIPEAYWPLLECSWKEGESALYGRFDLHYDGIGPPVMLEYNADTPTSVYETGYFQWLWLEQAAERGLIPAQADQFNALQELLIERFMLLSQQAQGRPLYFSCCKGSEEDKGTVTYLRDCAIQAGWDTQFIFIEDIGLSTDQRCYTDLDDLPMDWGFQLYPWEFMFDDPYAPSLLTTTTHWLEPPWKAILSNKGILPILWELFPNHPNLLPAYFEHEVEVRSPLTHYVRKPLFSREGANVEIYRFGQAIEKSPGLYGQEGYVLQQYRPMPKFGDNYTVIGSWLANGEPAGIGIREDATRVTRDSSRFLPHIIMP